MILANKNTERARSEQLFVPNPKLRLREQFREVMRFKHYSVRTEETYWGWIRQFLVFCRDQLRLSAVPALEAAQREVAATSERSGPGEGERTDGWRQPRELGAAEVHAFLTHLATKRDVAAATQNQALNALVFLYDQVLHRPLG